MMEKRRETEKGGDENGLDLDLLFYSALYLIEYSALFCSMLFYILLIFYFL